MLLQSAHSMRLDGSRAAGGPVRQAVPTATAAVAAAAGQSSCRRPLPRQ